VSILCLGILSAEPGNAITAGASCPSAEDALDWKFNNADMSAGQFLAYNGTCYSDTTVHVAPGEAVSTSTIRMAILLNTNNAGAETYFKTFRIDYPASVSGVYVNGDSYASTTPLSATTEEAFSYDVRYTYEGVAYEFTVTKDAGADRLNGFEVKAAALSSAVVVSTSALPSATFGTNYTAPALTASGGTSPYTFAATGLPSGLTLNPSTGEISGTPTQAGTFTVNVTATDSTSAANGGPFTSPAVGLSLVVAPPTITVTTSPLPTGTFNENYLAPPVTVAGGTAPYTFTATGLPIGLEINATNGSVFGAPMQAGTFTVAITATDSTTAANGGPFSATSANLPLVVGPPTITISNTSLPNAVYGRSYSPDLFASGGLGGYTFSASGLPPGLSISGTTGKIVGVPTQTGTFSVILTATDSTKPEYGGPFTSDSVTLPLKVDIPGTLQPTIAAAFSPTTIVADGSATTTLSITLSNPNELMPLFGLSVDPANLPSGLTVQSISGDPCGMANLTPNGAFGVTATSGGLSPGQSCSFRLTLTSTVPGTYSYDTGHIAYQFGKY